MLSSVANRTESAPNQIAPISDVALAALELALQHVGELEKVHKREMTSGSANRLCGGDSVARIKAYEAVPGLLARLRMAEAKVTELEGSRFQPEGGHPLDDEAGLESQAHWDSLTLIAGEGAAHV